MQAIQKLLNRRWGVQELGPFAPHRDALGLIALHLPGVLRVVKGSFGDDAAYAERLATLVARTPTAIVLDTTGLDSAGAYAALVRAVEG